ncbi:restriction endonuclease subunit S [Maribacter litopenaei]|uniref:Restriction endonuclease subunit S n=1 Tax=Maribacter litopenaei TaxID=2976127 RepID=A0ABY5Y5N1_9FLAO|nr:restriction endonuclease subunit S [Maribacter litopenaei]UWX54342.1 restriction endonuclease subunit S [Maribacter litopenaei]
MNRGEYCYNKSYSNGYPMGAFKRLDDFDKAVVTTLYICFRLKENVDSNFMNQFFEAGRMKQGLMRIAQEGGRAHGLLNIGLSDFFGLKLQIPSVEEQTAIAQILNAADIEIQLLQEQMKQLELQKKGMMQQLLTGRKRLISN